MADDVKNWVPWDLDKLYWQPEVPNPQLAIKQGNEWVLAVTDWVVKNVVDIIHGDWDIVTELDEFSDNKAIEILDKTEEEFSKAISFYRNATWSDFWYFQGATMNIDMMWLEDSFPFAKADTIEAEALFSIAERRYNSIQGKKSADTVYLVTLNRLLKKLKETKDKRFWAQRLYFIVLMSEYIVNYVSNIPKDQIMEADNKYRALDRKRTERYWAGKPWLNTNFVDSYPPTYFDSIKIYDLYDEVLLNMFKFEPKKLDKIFQEIKNLSWIDIYNCLVKHFVIEGF